MKLSNLNTTVRVRLARIRKDKLVLLPFVGGLVCAVTGATLIPFVKNSLPEMVPLFYSLPRAAERLASRDFLFMLPISTFAIVLINFLGIFFFVSSDRVIARMLSFSALLVAILSLYTLLRIVFLII